MGIIKVATFFCLAVATTFVNSSPLLLKGVISDGTLVLEKADAEFLNFIEQTLDKTDSNAIGSSFSKIVDGIATTLAKTTQMTAPLGMIVAPLQQTLLLNPISLSEGLMQDLSQTGQSVLKIAFDPKSLIDSGTTNFSNIVEALSDISTPVEVSGLRGALRQQIETLPENGSSVLNNLKNAMSVPFAVLESTVEKSGNMIREAVPIEFGPLFQVALTN